MTLKGIDISSWQSGIDVASTPCDFVIVKATGGTGYNNPDFKRAADATLKAGKLLGIYHYAREEGCMGSATDEARHFLDAFKPYIGKAIPVLDWEASAVDLPTSWAKEWLDTVAEETGARPWFYSYSNAVNNHDYSSISGYPLWIAAYYAGYETMGYQDNPPLYGGTGAWSHPTCYQYTSSGRIGYGGNLDLNIFYGDKEDWAAFCGNSEPKPKSKIDTFCERMYFWCKYANLGYDQSNRWDIRPGGECDCSSLVYWCLWEAGILPKPDNPAAHTLYTGTLRKDLKSVGYTEVAPSLSNCRPGDILLSDANHVAAVVSGYGTSAKCAQASIDEHGNIAGGASGDQTDKETNVVPVYSYPWDVIMRPPSSEPAPTPKPTADVKFRVKERGKWQAEGYPGTPGYEITGIAIDMPGWYQVCTARHGWLPPVSGYDIFDEEHGWAGSGDDVVIAVRCYYETPAPPPYKYAKYRVSNVNKDWWPWQRDNEVDAEQDGYAGNFYPIDRFELKIE